MRAFKLLDVLLSAGLIALFIVLLKNGELYDNEFSVAYTITGAWQLISMFVHFLNKWNTAKGGVRYYYHRIVAYYLPSIWLFFLVLNWFVANEEYGRTIWTYSINISSTIMAVFYTALCCIELLSIKPGAETNSTH